ncbi:EXS (ERD1/XPR1/SYG1) family protein [Theobroma cacao]|uniref:EXS (ERD1/XPR1/SYG1) family protein n=1 Tax=Theobroma cacao TaxID=3641 RepID=A0A061EB38_THECC|nr:EXS (ERD1/XPR1/SYG1) family protein [Theobroma cacao]
MRLLIHKSSGFSKLSNSNICSLSRQVLSHLMKRIRKQMVPEWTEAYVDYNVLKSILGELLHHKLSKQPATPLKSLQKKLSLRRTLSGLHLHPSNLMNKGDVEDQVTGVDRLQKDDSGQFYRTEFLGQSGEGGEIEVEFFRTLDEEFNKVNTFYKQKIEAVMDKAALLNKRMDALIALRMRVQSCGGNGDSLREHQPADISTRMPLKETTQGHCRTNIIVKTSFATVVAIVTGRKTTAKTYISVFRRGEAALVAFLFKYIEATSPYIPFLYAKCAGMGFEDSSYEVEMRGRSALEESSNFRSGGENIDVILQEINQDEESTSGPEFNPFRNIQKSNGYQVVGNSSASQQDPLEILERVKINNTLESPLSTIKGLFKDSKDDELCFEKDELRKVEKRLRKVFIEFYQKLQLLKHYSFMNLTALSKIMKTYEKIASRRAARPYMKRVKNSYIGSCDEVNNLLERVEAIFVKHFSNANIQEGMKSLRPKSKKEKHSVTFGSGFFSGFSIALLIAVVLRMETRKLTHKEGASYMVNVFPLYRQ